MIPNQCLTVYAWAARQKVRTEILCMEILNQPVFIMSAMNAPLLKKQPPNYDLHSVLHFF